MYAKVNGASFLKKNRVRECVVPENIRTPHPRKVTGNSEGEGGSKAEISEGSGGFIGSSFSRG